MEKQRLEELKTEAKYYGKHSESFRLDVIELINEAIARIDNTPNTDDSTGVTNFERWKAQLTIDYLSKHEIIHCIFCPAQEYCGTQPESKGCGTIIKEWGEQHG